MRQMKEQQDRNRAAECRRNREIASLKKDQRRAEVTGWKHFFFLKKKNRFEILFLIVL